MYCNISKKATRQAPDGRVTTADAELVRVARIRVD